MPRKKELRPFEEARDYARALGLKGKNAWYEHVKSDRRPKDIPYDPHKDYKTDG